MRFSVFTDIYRGLVSLVLPTSPATGSLTDLIRALEKRALSTPTAGSLGEIANVIQDAAADTAPTSGSVVDLIRVLEKRAISGAAADSVGARIDAAVSSRSSHTAADVWTAATRVPTSLAGLLINNIQYGTISFDTGDTSQTATITAVTVAKKALIFLGSSTNATTTNDPKEYLARITLTNTTTVTGTRGGTGATMVVSFVAVEFK